MKMKKVRWTNEEILFLKENYTKIGLKYCSENLNRSYKALIQKATRLGLKSEPKWSDNDILFLKENYTNLGAVYCSEKLNKTITSIYFKANKLQLTEKRIMWNDNDILFLKENYLNLGINGCAEILCKSISSIQNKLNELSLTNQNIWSEEDDIFLTNNYSKLGINGCAEILNRSTKSIKARTNKLKLKLITNDELINKFIVKHHNFYDYKLVNYINSKIKIKIICPKHGEFEQLANMHLKGQGCPICKESKGEKEIRNYLNNNNITFLPQHKFDDCKYINKLPFDFYLPDLNMCIEFHGQQHYEPIKWFGGQIVFDKLIKRDKIKEDYCIKNNIKLIIIPYRKNIYNIINNIL